MWVPCEMCDDYWCTEHDQHVADCDCPPREEWTTDPYGNDDSAPASA